MYSPSVGSVLINRIRGNGASIVCGNELQP